MMLQKHQISILQLHLKTDQPMGHNPKAFVTTVRSLWQQNSAFVTPIVEMIGRSYQPDKGRT